MKFPCAKCGDDHGSDAVVLTFDDGVYEYGIACLRAMASEVDGLPKGLIEIECERESDPMRKRFLTQRLTKKSTPARRAQVINIAHWKGK